MTTQTGARIDADGLNALLGQAVVEFGATVDAALVVIGDRLGLYRALAAAGRLTPAELARRTGTAERYVREWLGAQAPDAEPTRPAYLTGCASRSPAPTDSPARAMTWSSASTACTTWAIRSPPPATFAARSPTTGRG